MARARLLANQQRHPGLEKNISAPTRETGAFHGGRVRGNSPELSPLPSRGRENHRFYCHHLSPGFWFFDWRRTASALPSDAAGTILALLRCLHGALVVPLPHLSHAVSRAV